MTRIDFQVLRSLAAYLVGEDPPDMDWDAIVELANQTITITALAAAALSADRQRSIPDDVRQYLAVIHASNLKRNAMLAAQLDNAAECLNDAGIEPIVMKGAAILMEETSDPAGRILTDLDLLVRPARMHDAIRALQAIGYEVRIDGGIGSWPGDPDSHLPTVLDRPSDAGSIDLHCRPKGPASFKDVEWLYTNSRRVPLGGGYIYVPSGFAQIVYLVLHDQFQDGDYWRGLIDLRHLLDIVRISQAGEQIDWAKFRSLFARGYEQNATDTQILTLHALFGAPDFSELKIGVLPRRQLDRRKLQLGKGYLRHLLTVVTLFSEIPHYPSWDRYGDSSPVSSRHGWTRLTREVRRIFRRKPLGKA
ncbi:nucleotidyltransferase family protein [Ensifer canadensis]